MAGLECDADQSPEPGPLDLTVEQLMAVSTAMGYALLEAGVPVGEVNARIREACRAVGLVGVARV